MAKPIAKHVEYDLGIALGRLVLNDKLKIIDDAGEQSAEICLDDKAEIAAVLLAAAQHLLASCPEDVSKRVLLEGGLLESNALRASNDLKALKLEVNEVKPEAQAKQPKKLLTEKTEQILLEGGIKPETVCFLSAMSWCATSVNNSKNPVKATATLMAKPHIAAMFEDWLKKHNPVPQTPSEPPADNPTVFQINEDDVELPKSKAFEIND